MRKTIAGVAVVALVAAAVAAGAAPLPWRPLAPRDLNYQRGVQEAWELRAIDGRGRTALVVRLAGHSLAAEYVVLGRAALGSTWEPSQLVADERFAARMPGLHGEVTIGRYGRTIAVHGKAGTRAEADLAFVVRSGGVTVGPLPEGKMANRLLVINGTLSGSIVFRSARVTIRGWRAALTHEWAVSRDAPQELRIRNDLLTVWTKDGRLRVVWGWDSMRPDGSPSRPDDARWRGALVEPGARPAVCAPRVAHRAQYARQPRQRTYPIFRPLVRELAVRCRTRVFTARYVEQMLQAGSATDLAHGVVTTTDGLVGVWTQ